MKVPMMQSRKLLPRILGTTFNLALLMAASRSMAQPAMPKLKPWTWPDAPNHGRPNSILDVDGVTYPVVIDTPSSKLPLKAAVDQPAAEIPALYRGRVAYGTRSDFVAPGEKPLQKMMDAKYFLILRSIGFEGQLHGQLTNTASYRQRHFPDPPGQQLFLPDGSGVFSRAFLIGAHDAGPDYVWDFAKGQFRGGGGGKSVSQVFLSPDGHWAAQTAPEEHELQDTPWQSFAGKQTWAADLKIQQKYKFKLFPDASQRSMAWSGPNTLLYTQQPAHPDDPAGRPSIHEARVPGGASHLVIANAYDPAPSPDGRFIAFFGWPGNPNAPAVKDPDEITGQENLDPNSAQALALSTPRLFIFDRASKKRYPVSDQAWGFLAWTPDSRRLIMVATGTPGTPDIGTPARVRVANLSDILAAPDEKAAASVVREVATVNAEDKAGGFRIWPRNFRLAAVARNGRYIVLDVNEFQGENTGLHLLINRKSLVGVELDSGRVTTLDTLLDPNGDVQGWDWHDDSDSTGNNVALTPGYAEDAPPLKPAAKPPARRRSRSGRHIKAGPYIAQANLINLRVIEVTQKKQ